VETLFRAGLSNAVSATLMALLVACLRRPLARRPAVLHCLWFVVLLKLVTPPLYEVPLRWPALFTGERGTVRSAPQVVPERFDARLAVPLVAGDSCLQDELSQDALAAEPVVPPARLGDQGFGALPLAGQWLQTNWVSLGATAWLGGTVLALFVSCLRIARFRRLLDAADPAPVEVQDWVGEMAAGLGLRRQPVVWWIEGTVPPLIWPLDRRPRVIIPIALWKSLDEQQRATLILHELAHLQRGDHHMRFFELFVTALYWWHPVVWCVRRAMRDVEEQCCDAWVVWALPWAARSYAETLLATVEFLNRANRPEPMLASGFGRVHHLRRRLTMIMSGSSQRLLGVWGGLVSIGLAAVLLPASATRAQKPEADDKEERDVKVVVKSLGEGAGFGEGIAVFDAGDGSDLVLRAPAPGDKSEIEIVLKSDDTSDVVVAHSIDEAITKLKSLIAEIQNKSDRSERDGQRLKALQRAVERLAQAGAELKRPKDATANSVRKSAEQAVEKHIVALRRLEDLARIESGKSIDGTLGALVRLHQREMTPEARADLEKIRAKVRELSRELDAKRRELAAAQRELARLAASAHAVIARQHDHPESPKAHVEARAKIVERREVESDSPKKPAGADARPKAVRKRIEVHVGHGDSVIAKPAPDDPRSTDSRAREANRDSRRIDALEEALKKLLGEVQSLKKDRSPE
jgi:beta-lactamase regulating signal transducer with metallopeptidase domain